MIAWNYAIAPFVGYFTAGGLKFAVNCVRSGRLAFDQIGLGGLPSTHTTIVTTVAALIGFRAGADTPAFSVALALLCIGVIDAMDLRQRIGTHARLIKQALPDQVEAGRLRESMGHSPVEIAAGLITGVVLGFAIAQFP